VKMGLAAGAVGYVVKPFDPAVIIQQVANLLADKPKPRPR